LRRDRTPRAIAGIELTANRCLWHAALRRLVAHTFERHLRNENYIRIVMSENIHRGEYLRKSQYIQELNVPAIAAIRELYQRGVEQGVFRPGLDPVDIHASISALSFFNVSNRHSFGLIFKLDTASVAVRTPRPAAITPAVATPVAAPRKLASAARGTAPADEWESF